MALNPDRVPWSYVDEQGVLHGGMRDPGTAAQGIGNDAEAPEQETQVAENALPGTWSDIGKSLGGKTASTAPAPAPTASTDDEIPNEGRALLDLISGPESQGHYDIRYTPDGGTRDFGFGDHPRQREVIRQGPYAGLTSDAAGRYQILSSTWDPIAQRLGVRDFLPQSQDRVAWQLAQDQYRNSTKRDLLSDLRSPQGANLQALRQQWSTLPRAFLAVGGQPPQAQPIPTDVSGARPNQSPPDTSGAAPQKASSWAPLDPSPLPGTQPPTAPPSLWSNRPGPNPELDRERFNRQFDRAHSMERDGWLWPLVGSVGTGFNEGLSDILGLPGAAVHDAMLALGAGSWFSPLPWKEAGKSVQTLTGALNLMRPPMPQEIRSYGREGGLSFAPIDEGGFAGVGHAIGATVGAALPLAGAGAVWPEFLPARLQPEARTSPGKFIAKEGVTEPAAVGFGAGDVGEIYRNLMGNEADPTTQSVVAGVGGLLLSPRVPVLGALSRTGARVANSVYQRARSLISGTPDLAAIAQMSPEQARLVVGGLLTNRLTDALNEARYRVSTMTNPREIELQGLSGSQLQTRAAELVSQELRGWLRDGAATERALWDAVPGDLPRDFSQAAAATKKMRADFATDVENRRNPSDFPKDAGKLIEDLGGVPGTLEIGKNIHSRLQQAIREEAAAAVPNRARIGYLRRMDDAVMQDMMAGSGGDTPDAVKAYRNALAFSRSFAELRNSNELFDVLARDKSGAERVGAAETLDRFLKSGQAGVTAAQQLQGAAEMRYGPDRMLGAVKDALRQKYIEQVAPQGYVSMQDHQQFMRKFGGFMSNPKFSDLAEEFNQAARSEQDALSTLSLGKNRTQMFGRSLNAADARTARTELWLDNPVETVMGGLLRAPNQGNAAEAVMRQLQRDPTGEAVRGFGVIVADMLLNNPQGFIGISRFIKENAGLMTALDRVNPGFTDRARSLGDWTTSAGRLNFATDLAMRWAGSQAFEHLTKGVGSRLVMASAGSRAFRQWAENLSASDAMRVTAAAIADPAAYAALQRFSISGALKDFHLMHLYVPGLTIPSMEGGLGLNEEQQNEIAGRRATQDQKSGQVPAAQATIPPAAAPTIGPR